MGIPDKDFLELVTDLWNQYNSEPLFWVISAPFILWWVNFFRGQLTQSGVATVVRTLTTGLRSRSFIRLPERINISVSWPLGAVPPHYPARVTKYFTLYLLFVVFIILVATGFETGWFNGNWWTLFGFMFAYWVIWSAITNWKARKDETRTIESVEASIERLNNFSVVIGRDGFTLAQVFCKVGTEMRYSMDVRAIAIEVSALTPNNRATVQALSAIATDLTDQLVSNKLAKYRTRFFFRRSNPKEIRLTSLGTRVLRELCPRTPRRISVHTEES